MYWNKIGIKKTGNDFQAKPCPSSLSTTATSVLAIYHDDDGSPHHRCRLNARSHQRGALSQANRAEGPQSFPHILGCALHLCPDLHAAGCAKMRSCFNSYSESTDTPSIVDKTRYRGFSCFQVQRRELTAVLVLRARKWSGVTHQLGDP